MVDTRRPSSSFPRAAPLAPETHDVDDSDIDIERMDRALELGRAVRAVAPPNPWVGCVIEARDGTRFEGATAAVGGPHAEAAALAAAVDHDLTGATAWVSLEPCSHQGRTPPCADALLAAGVQRVVVAIEDPDPLVAGRGLDRLRAAGVTVDVGVRAAESSEVLAPYVHHRRTGRPYVVLKLAASLDGRTAAPDGSSRWITGPEARADVHALRAESDAILVGAGTVRADDPALTVRDADAPRGDPERIVLGHAPEGARVRPCLEHHGDVGELLDQLGAKGHLQLLVEGGATVAHDLHARRLVDRYVLYVAPVLFGGDDGRPLFAGEGAATIEDVWRGRIRSVTRLGDDLRIDVDREIS